MMNSAGWHSGELVCRLRKSPLRLPNQRALRDQVVPVLSREDLFRSKLAAAMDPELIDVT